MNYNCSIKEVQFSCDRNCGEQINTIIEELNINLPLLNEDQVALIDDYLYACEDGLVEGNAELAEAQKLLKKYILSVFKFSLQTMQELQTGGKANKSNNNSQNRNKLSPWDQMMQVINSLANLADQMPINYYNELFAEVDKISKKISPRAALKFCSTLFSIIFYKHRTKKLQFKSDPERFADFSEAQPILQKNLLDLYCTWVQLAGHANYLNEVPHTIDDLQLFINEWDLVDTEHEANIWKALFVQLKKLTSQGKAASIANETIDRESALVLTDKVMLKMLSAASRVFEIKEQEQLANMCILHSLRDKHCYLYDSLLNTKCVQLLKGTPSYKILEIFTKGVLTDYRAYINTSDGQAFLGELAKSEAERTKTDDLLAKISSFLQRKMRQLTFIELANQCIRNKRYGNGEPNMEASLCIDSLKEHLDLADDNIVEEFIIDAIRTNMVKAKLNMIERKVKIHYAVPRQFQRANWEELFNRLNNWRDTIGKVNEGFDNIINKVAPEVFKNSVA